MLFSPAAHPHLFCTGDRGEGAARGEACKAAVEKKKLSRLHNFPLSIIYSVADNKCSRAAPCSQFTKSPGFTVKHSSQTLRKVLFPVKRLGFNLAALKGCFGVFPLLCSFIRPPLIDPSLPTNFVYYTHYL